MYAKLEKPKEDKNSVASNSVTQKKSNGKQGIVELSGYIAAITKKSKRKLARG